ncbi:MAG TPA: type II toxin-antitoxin system VapC family toxin [Vicinamibacterales bacterium]|nr:type II toxin-antitoxin system VapC family toxin [Vicinamibacterales bacterium]
MILVDTSVWVNHLRRTGSPLAARLEAGDVLCHPYVIGEISLGLLKRRTEVIALLASLPSAPVVSHDDAMAFVDRRGLAGRGIGWIDVHLAASAVVSGARLWSDDRRLAEIARDLRIAP